MDMNTAIAGAAPGVVDGEAAGDANTQGTATKRGGRAKRIHHGFAGR